MTPPKRKPFNARLIHGELEEINAKLECISHHVELLVLKLNTVLRKERQMALDLTALTQAVARDTEVDQSAKTLLEGLTAKIQELIAASGNTVDPAALQSIVDGINGTTDQLAAAVAANTPAG